MNVRMINTIGRWLASCLLLFMVSSCIDDGFESPSQGVIDKDGMVNLTINANVPGLKVTRSVDVNGEAIATLWVLAFNENGNMTSRVLATQTNNVQGSGGGAGTFSAKVPASTRILHFLANVNMDNFSDQENIGRHENEVVAPLVSKSGKTKSGRVEKRNAIFQAKTKRIKKMRGSMVDVVPRLLFTRSGQT